MKSKIIVGLLAFLLVFTAAASLVNISVGTVSADTSNGFGYTIINNGTAVEINNYTGPNSGNITIPNSIGGLPVTMIGDKAFFYLWGITGVTIPSTVTYIGYWAFNSDIKLNDVSIPSGVSTIGPGAFEDCFDLKSVTIPSGVTTMGTYAFSTYEGGLISATINSHFVSDDAFEGCGRLASVTFGSGFDSIGNQSFYACSSLPAITIPSTVTYIGVEAFSYCHSLAINVAPGNPDFASANGTLYNKNMTTLIACPGAAGVFNIPNGVTTIGDYAFEQVLVSSVTIPSSVTTIGNYAFQACYGMTSVTIGSGVTTIGYSVFFSCDALTNMDFYGLTAPTSVQADSWIYDTHGLFGHAYYASNFPAPGHIWAGLTMGSYLSNTSVVPGAPTGLVANGGPGFIFLNWTAPVNVGIPPLTQYAIYRGTSSGGYGSPLITLDSNIATYNDTTATPGTQYYYVVKAINTAGSSLASNEATAEATTSAQSVPGAPTNLQAAGYDGYVILTWNAPANAGNPALTEYSIWRGATADSLALRDYSNTLTYNDTYVTNGQTYVYAVKAMNTVNSSAASNTATATPSANPTPPGAPTNLVANGLKNRISLSWTAPANPGSGVSNYLVYRGTTAGGEGTTPIATVTQTTYLDTSVTPGTPYYYIVKASNAFGSSSASNEATGNATSPTAPSAPQDMTATGGTNKVTLTWTAPADDGGMVISAYKVYRSNNGSAYAQVGSVQAGSLSYVDTNVTVGYTYSYYVVAVNSIGAGAQSTTQSAAPQGNGGGATDNSALYIGIVIVIIVVVLLLFWFMRRRK
ncbi:MAG: fibronectin type III domain-containing protein [Methanomassiliicoccales archaeon]